MLPVIKLIGERLTVMFLPAVVPMFPVAGQEKPVQVPARAVPVWLLLLVAWLLLPALVG